MPARVIEGVTLKEDEVLEKLSSGELKIIQKKGGYRYSVDAILLSQFISFKDGARIIDIGTGSGILPLLLSRKGREAEIWAVEVQEELVDMFQRSLRLNRLESRIKVLAQDFRHLPSVFPPQSFDLLCSNPPYRKLNSGRLNPDSSKAISRHEIMGTLKELISVSSYLLKSKGRAIYIYLVSRLPELLLSLHENDLEPKTLQFIHYSREHEADLFLIEAVKGGRAGGLKILRPLIVSEKGDSL